MRLVLVRHPPPLIDLSRDPREWVLVSDAQAHLDRLSQHPSLAGATRLLSSPAPKAQATAQHLARALAIPVEEFARLRDLRRHPVEDLPPALARVFAHPAQPAAPGWETLASVATRVSSTLADARAHPDGKTLLVGHAIPFTFVRARLLGERPTAATCARIALPDVAEIEVDADGRGTLVRDFGGVDRG